MALMATLRINYLYWNISSPRLSRTCEVKTVEDPHQYASLLVYIVTSELRSEKMITDLKYMSESMFITLEQDIPECKREKARAKFIPQDEEMGKLILGVAQDMWSRLTDLEICVLKNETTRKFITSDAPLAKYNFYLEKRKYTGSSLGLGTQGGIASIPLSPDVLLFAYDSEVYTLQKQTITNRDDVDIINKIQMMNAHKNIFYSSEYAEKHIQKYVSSVPRQEPEDRVIIQQLVEVDNDGEIQTFKAWDGVENMAGKKPSVIHTSTRNNYAGLILSILKIKPGTLTMPLYNHAARLHTLRQSFSDPTPEPFRF